MEHSIQAGRVGLMVDIIHLVPRTFTLAVDTIQVAKLKKFHNMCFVAITKLIQN